MVKDQHLLYRLKRVAGSTIARGIRNSPGKVLVGQETKIDFFLIVEVSRPPRPVHLHLCQGAPPLSLSVIAQDRLSTLKLWTKIWGICLPSRLVYLGSWGDKRWHVLQLKSWFIHTQCPMSNRGIFGIYVNHIVRSDSMWNSLSLWSSSSSRSSNSSSRKSSISSSSRHLASACSGLQCIYNSGKAQQGWSDRIQANPPGSRGLIGY